MISIDHMMTLAGAGRQGDDDELLGLAQLRELLVLPSSPAPTTAPVVVNNTVEFGGPLGNGGGPTTAPQPSDMAANDASCGRRRRRRGSKRGRDDDACMTGCRRGRKQQMGTSSLVTSAPDFDGYRWRKYGQKQIQGAMYPRSYYRCTRSAEQGCAAKRTVQRDDGGGCSGVPKYTVVYVGEHSCAPNDSLEEAPAILDTTNTNKRSLEVEEDAGATNDVNNSIAPTPAGGSACSTAAPAASGSGTAVSPATITGGTGTGSEYVDDYGGLFSVHDNYGGRIQEMEDLAGPIRSPLHIDIATADGWTIDQFLQQLLYV